MAAFEVEPLLGYTGNETDCHTFEMEAPNVQEKTTIIHSNQDWGVHVEWYMQGPLALFLDEEFRVTVFLEDLSPKDKDGQLGPVKVGTLTGALNIVTQTRSYKLDIPVKAGQYGPSVYKPTLLIQLFDSVTNAPWPVAAFAEMPPINIYSVPPITPP